MSSKAQRSHALPADSGQWEESDFLLNKAVKANSLPLHWRPVFYHPDLSSAFCHPLLPPPKTALNKQTGGHEQRRKSSKGRDFSTIPWRSPAVPLEKIMKTGYLLQGLEGCPERRKESFPNLHDPPSPYRLEELLDHCMNLSGLHVWTNLPTAATPCGMKEPLPLSTVRDRLGMKLHYFPFYPRFAIEL